MEKNWKATKKLIVSVSCMILIMLLSIVVKTDVYAQLTGTVTSASANVRAEASTSSSVIAGLTYGDEVSIVTDVTDSEGTLWYEIHVDADTRGYVAASLITKDGDSEPVTSVTPSESTTTTTSTTTSSGDYIDSEDQWKSATISSDSVRVRSDASTSSDILATVTKGVVFTVTGSKTGSDGYEWYQVSFKVDGEDYLGFIREDLISFESVNSEGETTVTGTLDPNASTDETETTTDSTENTEEATETPSEEPETVQTEEVKYTVIDTSETVEVPSGYIEVPIAIDNGETTAWKNGDFYIVYATSSDGDEGWYRYDTVSGVYQRYVESESISMLGSDNESENNLITYVLIGAIALLFIICLFLIVRVSDMKTDLKYGDDEDEDDEAEEDEDWEHEVSEEPEERSRTIRRNQEEDRKLAHELEEVLEQELVRESQAQVKQESKPKYEEDPEEYLKPDDEDSWDDEFDFIDLD